MDCENAPQTTIPIRLILLFWVLIEDIMNHRSVPEMNFPADPYFGLLFDQPLNLENVCALGSLNPAVIITTFDASKGHLLAEHIHNGGILVAEDTKPCSDHPVTWSALLNYCFSVRRRDYFSRMGGLFIRIGGWFRRMGGLAW